MASAETLESLKETLEFVKEPLLVNGLNLHLRLDDGFLETPLMVQCSQRKKRSKRFYTTQNLYTKRKATKLGSFVWNMRKCLIWSTKNVIAQLLRVAYLIKLEVL